MADDRPTVLIVGGFLTAPFNYRPLRRRLLARGAGRVEIAAVWPTDWLLAIRVGFGPLLRRTGEAIARTRRAAGGRPIIVVAHSGGGILARLAMSRVAFRGRIASVGDAVGVLVTLGTPHGLARLPAVRPHAGHEAARFLDDTTPDAASAARTRYLTVGSRAIEPRAGGWSPIDLVARRIYTAMLGPSALTVAGDGVVPAHAAHLDGARQITFSDVTHGHVGAGWYGDEEVVDRWWHPALEEWRAALRERSFDRSAGVG